jgi:hypothetical protein
MDGFFHPKKSQINQDLVEDRMKNDLSHIETIARSRFEKCWGSGKFQGSLAPRGRAFLQCLLVCEKKCDLPCYEYGGIW